MNRVPAAIGVAHLGPRRCRAGVAEWLREVSGARVEELALHGVITLRGELAAEKR